MFEYELNGILTNCKIICASGASDWRSFCPESDSVLLVDDNVNRIYENQFVNYDKIIIPSGESHKNMDTVMAVTEQLLSGNYGRDALLVAVGGGVTTDIAGFIASIYKRGTRCGFVPTTLMAMADAAVGGKNGVNFGEMKNVLGLIRQPEFVFIDTNFLLTLPEDDYYSAFSEIIKTGLIDDTTILDEVEASFGAVHSRDKGQLEKLIGKCAASKVAIVSHDEQDRGARNILNFGHTTAHAFELRYAMTHGKAVAAGLLTELKLSEMVFGTAPDIFIRTGRLLKNLGLYPAFQPDYSELSAIIANDKKNTAGNSAGIILLKDYSQPIIHKFDLNELIQKLNSIRFL